ncbi:fungal-specific transcription factor domain-containing protein [Mycena metata]|uniref:Fungal-specific transcription factor domain-containing protein n=1 Tax=Mycena metata TaxID=1033252 RepID=A0AAD7JF24_9AGAR|nr:fungal-specific transcription factor domain-containing protein [Mycena metata]
MSANEEELEANSRKGRRRACDLCRRRKTRCDGSEVPGSKCTTCLDLSVDCTYREATVKRASQKNYVDSLEEQLDQSMVLINQLRSELAAAHFKGTTSDPPPSSRIDTATAPINNAYNYRIAAMGFLRARLRAFALPSPPPHGDDLDHLDLARNLEQLSLDRSVAPTFFGKGSGATLVTAVLGIKADVERSEAWSRGHTPEHSLSDASVWEGGSWMSREMRFRTFKPWQRTSPRAHTFTRGELPPAAMITDLTELYFTHQNVYVPLLHRPTFERAIADGLHFRDYDFAATVILVCAIASRWSADPGVFHLGADTTAGSGRLASGWRWFNQVRDSRNEMSGPATLHDLQYYCLAVQFLECSCEPPMCWTLVGFGLRRAQDIGAHRMVPHEVPSAQSELLKRAFWVLMYMDRLMSAGTGRTCALEETDVDVKMPIECDDEYWEHPTHPFQQPPGLPSKVVFFNRILRLNHLLSFSMRLLYPLNKARAAFDFDDAFEETLVAELDSALNDWYEGIPAHLRWDPQRTDLVFFNQSVTLHCQYYHLQIYIHRRFIPSLRKSGPTGLPSLALCTSAARACANMVDIQRRRTNNVPTIINMLPAFTAGIVLLLNVWSGKRMGVMANPSREMVNVQKCMEVVRLCEDRWQAAGPCWDILAELASVGGLPLLSSPPAPSPSGRAHVSLDSAYTSIPHPQAPPVNFDFSNGGLYTSLPMEASMFAQALPQEPSLPPHDTLFMDPAEVSRELGDMMNLLDSETIAMWTNAPVGFRMEEWGNYFNDFSEIMQGLPAS